jgi:hypothetical protein
MLVLAGLTLPIARPTFAKLRQMQEPIHRFATLEQARNAAMQWLEALGVSFGPRRTIVIGRLGTFQGAEVGVQSEPGQVPFWRLRLDFDPHKGAHFNAEFGTGPQRKKAAFTFPGAEAHAAGLRRRPR